MTRRGLFEGTCESKSVSRSQNPDETNEVIRHELSKLSKLIDQRCTEIHRSLTQHQNKLEIELVLLNRKTDLVIRELESIRNEQFADTAIGGTGTKERPFQVFEVGDTVRSINKPFHHGTVTRLSRNGDFVFIRTNSGKEETKKPDNLVITNHGGK